MSDIFTIHRMVWFGIFFFLIWIWDQCRSVLMCWWHTNPPQMVTGSTAVRWSVFVQSWWNINLNGDRRIKFFLEHYWLPKSMLITMCLDTSITTVPCGHLTSAFVSFMDEYLITLISELSTCIFCVFSVHCTLIKTY